MSKKDFFLILLMCIGYGVNMIFAKQVLTYLDPFFFTAIRFFIIAIVTILFIPKLILDFKTFKSLFFISFILVILNNGLGALAFKIHDSAMILSSINHFSIVFTIIASIFFLKEKLSKQSIVGIVIAFSGIMIIAINDLNFTNEAIANPNSINNIIATCIFLIALFAWAIYAIFAKKHEKSIKPLQLIALVSLIGSIQAFIISLIFEKNQFTILFNMNYQLIFYLFYTALVGILAVVGIFQYLIQRHKVSIISAWKILTPISTILIAVIFLDEKFTAIIACGSLLIFFGVFILSYYEK